MSRAREVSCSSSALSRPRSSRSVASARSCTSAPSALVLARSNASASLTRERSSSASFAAGDISGMACSSHWGRPARFTHIRTETARLARSAALLSAKSDRMSAPVPNPLLELRKLGQSAWLDDISRRMLREGTLARLIRDDGIAGLTSNPAIFGNAITTDPEYARPIAELLPRVSSSLALYEELAIEDLRAAAALLRPLYDSSSGGDGFVSMEVSPHLAYDGAGSLAEARRLWERLRLPNALIKIPGTEAGLPVIRELVAAGINVNVTLLFSPERYRAVARAYMGGLEARAAAGQSLETLASSGTSPRAAIRARHSSGSTSISRPSHSNSSARE